MRKLVYPVLILAVLLAGCQNEGVRQELQDGYQVDDILRGLSKDVHTVWDARNTYCDRVKDKPLRNIALGLLRVRFPEIPPDGICGTLPAEYARLVGFIAGKDENTRIEQAKRGEAAP